MAIHFKILDESEDAGKKETVSICSSSSVCITVILGSIEAKQNTGVNWLFKLVALQLQISKSGPLGLHCVNKLTP